MGQSLPEGAGPVVNLHRSQIIALVASALALLFYKINFNINLKIIIKNKIIKRVT